MVDETTLETRLCKAFCADLKVRAVEDGFAIATPFTDESGDRMTFFAVREVDGWLLADDGDYLASLIGAGIDIETSQRGDMLDRILREADAYWDRDTFEIKSSRVSDDDHLPDRAIRFLSGLLRTRDLSLMTREAVRATFRDDARKALFERLAGLADIEEGAPVSKSLEDIPADFLVSPRGPGNTAAIFVVTRNERLMEALLLQAEAQAQNVQNLSVIALLEDTNFSAISRKNLKRAHNRLDGVPVFRGDERAAIESIVRVARLEAAG
ncbi:DUF1828 domain-containing protein [Roseospira navarrensis]|uniref:DUF1828 domain-containing protein n=1 Tax=Roseospira navarrensis TaxID=140058 RepID=A0A7X1ZID4_9PROT|nr:DUF1828 domain-containing protein [Roseospira navarrensis]MQX37800.1 DUF1828 domain-containing protein [Roseospira navarrensis]